MPNAEQSFRVSGFGISTFPMLIRAESTSRILLIPEHGGIVSSPKAGSSIFRVLGAAEEQDWLVGHYS